MKATVAILVFVSLLLAACTAATAAPPPPAGADLIVDSLKIVGSSKWRVQWMLGFPIATMTTDSGEAQVIDGGEDDTYQFDNYGGWVHFDKYGTAQCVTINQGLVDDGYSVDQWRAVLARIGVDFEGMPDPGPAAAAKVWRDANGYSLLVAPWSDGRVWTAQICKNL